MTTIPVAPDMTDWTDESAWAGTRAPLRQSTGLNPSAYVDERFFALEQELVFERAWVTVGVAGEVAEPGRMLVRQVGQKSIVITRGDDGELRGFLNSCRHRGTELAEVDCDIAGTIRCPYHRWGYGTDGSLKATPFFDEVPRDDFDRNDFSLIPVRVGTWGPLLFACLADETPELDVWLGDLPERMAGYGFDQWRIEESQVLDIEANWKLISENFQEYYHLTWVHPELAKVSRWRITTATRARVCTAARPPPRSAATIATTGSCFPQPRASTNPMPPVVATSRCTRMSSSRCCPTMCS